jgi:hypothetical protein
MTARTSLLIALGWSIESAGQEPDSGIAAGSEIGPENTLKVETRVQSPLGLRSRNAGQNPFLFATGLRRALSRRQILHYLVRSRRRDLRDRSGRRDPGRSPRAPYATDKYAMAIATRAPESSHVRRTLGAGASL